MIYKIENPIMEFQVNYMQSINHLLWDKILTKKMIIDVVSIFFERKDLKFIWFFIEFSGFFDQIPQCIFQVTTYLNFS